MWPDAYGTDLSHFSFLDITKQKPKCTWLSGAITRQAHLAFPVVSFHECGTSLV